jgi:ABC-type nitrate/sulfonate/bicarbonate transport system substrate-binding protein
VALIVLFAGSATPAPAAAPAAFTLALDGPVAPSHAPWLDAAAAGRFAAAGLAVSIRYPAGRGAALAALAAGTVDACISEASAVLAARAGGTKLTIVASIGDLHPAAVLSRAASPIASPAGLVGKRVAVDPLDPDRLLFPLWLAAAGLRPEDVVVTPLDATGRDAALAAGTVDAALGRLPVDRPGLAALPLADHGFTLYGPCIAVREETLRSRGPVVRAFLKAALKAWEACLEDPAAEAAVAASTGLVAAADAEAWLSAEIYRFDTETYRKKGLGWIDKARMAATLEAVRGMLGQPVSFAAADAFSTAYLPVPAVLRKAVASAATAVTPTPQPLKR